MAELAGQVGKMVEHPKKMLAQPRSTTNWDALYCSTVCQPLLGLVGIWQMLLGNWAKWWKTQIQVNLTRVYDHMGHPV